MDTSSPDSMKYNLPLHIMSIQLLCLLMVSASGKSPAVPSDQIDGLMQERCNSIANALELHLSCINPSKRYGHEYKSWGIMKSRPVLVGEKLSFQPS